jgi:hypothetical protein
MPLLLALLALLLLAAPASADRADRAERLAERMWGTALQDTCPDGITVRWGRLRADALGRAWEGDCAVELNQRRRELAEWPPFCDTILHEAGHIVGHDHYHRGHRGVMLSEGMLTRDEVVYASGRSSVRWRGVHPWCQPGGAPPEGNMAAAAGRI